MCLMELSLSGSTCMSVLLGTSFPPLERVLPFVAQRSSGVYIYGDIKNMTGHNPG